MTGQSLIKSILRKMNDLNKSRKRFVEEILLLYLSHRGRINFLQMERQSDQCEKSYRYQFEQEFDWQDFNVNLVKAQCGKELIIGFDPSFINKSGKCSPGIGYFYSGCAGHYKRGIEIGSFAAVDIKQNTAYHLDATQSPTARRDRIDIDKTLVDHYGDILASKASGLEKLSKVLVCDAYFSKKKYVDRVCNDINMELICRLRDDANLKYLYKGPQSTGKGRPRKYASKIDVKNIDKRRLPMAYKDEDVTIYGGKVYSVGLKIEISLCYVEHQISESKILTKIYYSTNAVRGAKQILKYYRARYQKEFIFRDAKQYTGLEQCQARSQNKLNFHFNASLTSISVGKGAIRKGYSTDISMPLFNIKR